MDIAGLSDDESRLVSVLASKIRTASPILERLDGYYEGRQRLRHLGITAPDELLRSFETVVNVPALAVDEPTRRQRLRAFQRRDQAGADPVLREAWEANNLDSQAPLAAKDRAVYGRTFVSVSTNEEDPTHPLVLVENPAEMACLVDPRRRRMTAALRRWRRDDFSVHSSETLYLPDRTVWIDSDAGRRAVVDVDLHNLGRVPVVMFLNRPRAGRWQGTSEMEPVLGLTDGIARLITNMLVASETHAVPDKWAIGVSRGDFVDEHGKPLPTWETYFSAIKATSNPDARFGQFSASDLKNFHDSVNNMLSWCAASLGLPLRYTGQQSVNPAAEGAIRADESRLIKNTELMNAADGDSWAWVGALYERFRTGEWLPANELRVLWDNPATPTLAERADAMTKLHTQGLISREGVWDELGWDEPRKDRERGYLELERSDPAIDRIMAGVTDLASTSRSAAAAVEQAEGA